MWQSAEPESEMTHVREGKNTHRNREREHRHTSFIAEEDKMRKDQKKSKRREKTNTVSSVMLMNIGHITKRD